MGREAQQNAMKRPRALLAAAFLMILVGPDFLGAQVKVIANASVKPDGLSALELKRVFLEQINALADGTHVEPVLQDSGSAHASFRKDYLEVSEDDLQAYYRTLVFTGRGSMPKVLGSDADVVAYVARTRGAIGYVSSASSAEGVKTLMVWNASNPAERKLITRIQPDYPEVLRRLNIGGTVRLRVSISAKGNVEKVELLGGNPILGESAALAVKKWVYSAARSSTMAEVSVSFDGR
jgi:TonB family protein